jgi:hypothetical protein
MDVSEARKKLASALRGRADMLDRYVQGRATWTDVCVTEIFVLRAQAALEEALAGAS